MRNLLILATSISFLILSACGDDGGGTGKVDAPKPADARVVDAAGSNTDGSVDAPLTIDAPTSTIETVDCATVTPSATVTTTDGVFIYAPSSVTITVNQIVQFDMSSTHNVVPTTPNPDPGIAVGFNQTACKKFTAAGTFNFKCGPHGFTGMATVN